MLQVLCFIAVVQQVACRPGAGPTAPTLLQAQACIACSQRSRTRKEEEEEEESREGLEDSALSLSQTWQPLHQSSCYPSCGKPRHGPFFWKK